MTDQAEKPDPRDARMREIEDAAYELLKTKGPRATSMLEVAKQAKASNQTMYKWYGDKTGLFLAMVERNAETGAALLRDALENDRPLEEALATLGPALLTLVLSDKAVALNRAAAADAHQSTDLGQTIAAGGRGAIARSLGRLIHKTAQSVDAAAAAGVYLDLLIGDAQSRRIIGAMPRPDDGWIASRAAQAQTVFLAWLAEAASWRSNG